MVTVKTTDRTPFKGVQTAY